MRQGCFQIDVISNGDVAPEETLKDKTYAVVESGSEYFVQVKVFKNDDGSIPHEFLVFFLEIDGVDTKNGRSITITDRTSFPAMVTFIGFNGGSVAYKFGTTLTSAQVSGSQAVNVGTMKIVVYKGVRKGVKGESVPYRGEEKVAESICVSANKKFWQTASVATTAGRTLSAASSTSVSWRKADPKPMAEITLHYHTRAAVELLKLFHADSADSTTAPTSASEAPVRDMKPRVATAYRTRKRTRSSSATAAEEEEEEGEEEEEEEEDDMVEFVDRPYVKKEVPLVDLIEKYERSDEVIDLT